MAIKLTRQIDHRSITVPQDNCGVGIGEPYSLQRVGVTQSMLGKFQKCRRAWLYSINRWGSKIESRSTGYGSMSHDILEKMYRGITAGELRYEDLVGVIENIVENYNMGNAWTPEASEIEKAKVQAVMECYIQVYRKDFDELRFHAVEEPFSIQWKGYRLRGKKDGRFEDRNGGIWNMEHKNYSRISEDTMPLCLSFDLQNLFYILADKQEHGRLLSGVLYNILRNPTVAKKDGSPFQVYTKIKSDVTKDPRHYFIRYEIPYGKPDVDQFERELLHKLEDIERIVDAPAKDHFDLCYKNESGCTAPYRCEYLDACAAQSLVGYIQRPRLFNEIDTPE